MANGLKKLLPMPTTALSPMQHRQYMVLSVIAPIGGSVLAFFCYYNSFIIDRPFIALLTGITAIAFFGTYFYFRHKQQLTPAINLLLIGFTLFLITYNIENQNAGFGLAWTLLFPIFAIITAGRSWGLRFTIGLYLIMLWILSNGVGIWLNGLWDMSSLLRFSMVYFIVTYVIYVLELINENSHLQLQNLHANELNRIEQLQKMAITDALTGVYNRHYLNQTSPLIASQMQQQNAYLLFFITDLDWFKAFNDSFGHQQGDEVIQQISQIIAHQVKNLDGTLYRVSGEEFAGIIVTQQVNSAIEQIQKIATMIDKLNIANPNSPYRILTASTGLVVMNKDGFKNFDNAYQKAESALGRAKENGRNRTIIVDKRNFKL